MTDLDPAGMPTRMRYAGHFNDPDREGLPIFLGENAFHEYIQTLDTIAHHDGELYNCRRNGGAGGGVPRWDELSEVHLRHDGSDITMFVAALPSGNGPPLIEVYSAQSRAARRALQAHFGSDRFVRGW